ncbi:hypothetical protein K0M31_017500, partial [Melipona bicolor]
WEPPPLSIACSNARTTDELYSTPGSTPAERLRRGKISDTATVTALGCYVARLFFGSLLGRVVLRACDSGARKRDGATSQN